jgi:hypothetical protein
MSRWSEVSDDVGTMVEDLRHHSTLALYLQALTESVGNPRPRRKESNFLEHTKGYDIRQATVA